MIDVVVSVLHGGEGHDVRMLTCWIDLMLRRIDRKTVCVSTDLITLCRALWWIVASGDDVQNVRSARSGKVGWWKTLITKGEKGFWYGCLLRLVCVALELEDYNMSERSHDGLDDIDCSRLAIWGVFFFLPFIPLPVGVYQGLPAEDPETLEYPQFVLSVTQMGQIQVW